MALDPDIEAKYVHNGKVMLGSAILLSILILIIIFYRTYAHVCTRRRRHLFPHPLSTTTSATATATVANFNERLDPSVLKSLPTFTFSSAAHRPLHDCAVCLSEFEDGEKGRMLPNCGHAFHSDCIDMWFGSHSNCPLCRATVQPATSSSTVEECSVSVTETVEVEVGGCSSLPAPVMCPRKPFSLIVEVPEEDRGLDPRILSLKRFCSV